MTLDEALAHAATCTGESRTHEALRVLAAEFARTAVPIADNLNVLANMVPADYGNKPKLPPYGSCPTCLGKTIDGICGRCGL